MDHRPRMKRGGPPPSALRADHTHEEAVVHQRIADRAFELYLARGAAGGHDLDDWLQAEREVRAARAAGRSSNGGAR